MIKQIKKELIKNPEHIVNILDKYDFDKASIRNTEIRFGFGIGHNQSAISIRLENNNNLFVKDYVRSDISGDLFSYIIKARGTTFKDVLNTVKSELGIDSYISFKQKHTLFGGFYDNIRNHESNNVYKVYDDSVLDDFEDVYSMKFYEDYISFATQDYFGIGYDPLSQRITIPVYSPVGELIGVKGRATWDITEQEYKYVYLVPTAKSSTLYGYYENYEHLVGNTIYIGEAEKFVMQLHSYGIYNSVAIAGNSLSSEQCRLLMSLAPTEVVFMLDAGLDKAETVKNAELLSRYTRMSNVRIKWWNWENDFIEDKKSPTDFGLKVFNECLENVEDLNMT